MTSVYDDVTYDDVTEILVFIGTCSVTTAPVNAFTKEIIINSKPCAFIQLVLQVKIWCLLVLVQ